ncbi:M23 family metallopeptidase [Streptomyces sp. NPDC051976]|uniref:M23 family metallopeptidase n=1 Tax=Streptomyces sp. NPDC051976 TaxID=3154947 RepID=UPI003419FF58
MNERPSSGYAPDYDAYGYDAYSTGAYQTVGTAFADADPLFGPSPDATGSYAYVPQTPQYGHGYSYDHNGYGYDQPQAAPAPAPAQDTNGYGYDYGYGAGTYDTGTYDTGTYATGTTYATGAYDTSAFPQATYYDTGTYDSTAFYQADHQTGYLNQGHTAVIPQQQEWDSGSYPTYGYGYGYDAGGDTGLYEQMPMAPEPAPAPAPPPEPEPELVAEEAEFAQDEVEERHDYAEPEPGPDFEPAARSRRRKPAKRSVLLTVAVPSVAVMGVAAVGAAAVAGVGMPKSAEGQSDGVDAAAAKNAPTTQFDRQITGVSADADDFATRASRTQERLDLKDRQDAAKKAKEEAAARKEALRPKFFLPVKQKGLSAYFGQAGVNWMALHTGIDFPVQPGTPVMAVTDGTVRTQWNNSYGNMAIVTAPDGTETWYCHLSSTKIRSGSVKAGTVIAYSGNTGNTTGPHLHLEVRPHGGSPIDPLPWLLAHGLDPR